MFHRMEIIVRKPAGIVDEVFIREVESKGNIFIIAGLLIRLIIIIFIFLISAKLIKTRCSHTSGLQSTNLKVS